MQGKTKLKNSSWFSVCVWGATRSIMADNSPV